MTAARSVVYLTRIREADRHRSRRAHAVRSLTLHLDRMSRADRTAGAEPYPEDIERPRTRADCADVPRPCPFVSCRHHLYLDVSRNGRGVKLNWPDLEPDDVADSCALDVADGGGASREAVGAAMNLTRERVRQIETEALEELRPHMANQRDGEDAGPERPRVRLRVVA